MFLPPPPNPQVNLSTRLRIQGWSHDNRKMLKQLLWHHAVLYEELYGLPACSENLKYSLHMPEDIARHSTLDYYWCFLYERQVKYYKDKLPTCGHFARHLQIDLHNCSLFK